MGWKSDWLYKRIFNEVVNLWTRALRQGTGRFGPPPSALVIIEMRSADWENATFRGEARRQWVYQGGEPEPVAELTGGGEVRGMFYERGTIAFRIDGNRKRVLLTYVLGPRYGMGAILRVVGQGAKGRLAAGEGPGWIS